MRVQIPAYTDAWMRGDRYGDVVKVAVRKTFSHVDAVEIAHVKLDRTGKTVRVILDDCTVVDVEPRL